MRNTIRLVTTTLALLALGATPASAASLLSTTVEASDAAARNCSAGVAGGAGVVKRTVEVPAVGWVVARLEGDSGDWDVALFDGASGRRVAGSAFFGSSEVAQGFVTDPGELTVQACRRSGRARSAKLSVESRAVKAGRPQKLSLVRVAIGSPARKAELARLGLDLTEHGRDGFVEVVLHGAADARKLREAKFVYTTQVADLAAQSRRDRAADRRYARSVRRSGLPSGRDSGYRRLDDYLNEMKTMVQKNPTLVKPITLPFKTWTGMSVQGIEITENVNARDGKPVFLQMGIHHAREWPSGEHAIEWAHELVNGYRAGSPRVRRLMAASRTIVIPVVNPEGFVTSREAASALDDGRGAPAFPNETVNFATFPYEYHRKNCRVNNDAEDDFESTADDDPPEGDCTQLPAQGLSQFGADPNRNYGGFWGGPGASPSGPAPGGDFAQDYRGTGPFSEPETRNIRDLVSKRHVVTAISNHTYTGLLLRPPAIAAQGPTVDEPLYGSFGREMAAHNGYRNQASFRLYDTSGGFEDWSYYATGGFGFTYEIGSNNFHPSYSEAIAEYEGGPGVPGEGKGGNREAYFKAQESTANAARHSVITGGAPAGHVLRLKKGFKTATSPIIDSSEEVVRPPLTFDDMLNTSMVVPSSGAFEWHINPSTRPVVAQTRGRAARGNPSPPVTETGKLPPQPPCPAYFELGSGACPPTSYEDIEISIPSGAGVDNAFVDVKIEWTDPDATDYDLELYRDANGDGDLDDTNEDNEPESEPISSSASGGTTVEKVTLGPDPGPGKYFARVINYAGAEPYDYSLTYRGPEAFRAGRTETWTLTCETPDGRVRASQQLLIARGQRKAIDFGSACPSPKAAAASCVGTRGGVRSSSVGSAKLGRNRSTQRRRLRVARLARGRRSGIDRYCVQGGGTMRVGYPTKRFNKRVSRRTRRRYASKSIFIVSNSKKFRIRRIRAGSSVTTLRRRLKGERSFKIGKIRWYTVAGRRSRVLFSTRRGRVREVGLASKRLTSTRRGTVRLLRAWDQRG